MLKACVSGCRGVLYYAVLASSIASKGTLWGEVC